MQGLLPSWWEGSFVSHTGFWEVLLNLYHKNNIFQDEANEPCWDPNTVLIDTMLKWIQSVISSTHNTDGLKGQHIFFSYRNSLTLPHPPLGPAGNTLLLQECWRTTSSSKQTKTEENAFHYLSLFCSLTRQVGVCKYMSAPLRD